MPNQTQESDDGGLAIETRPDSIRIPNWRLESHPSNAPFVTPAGPGFTHMPAFPCTSSGRPVQGGVTTGQGTPDESPGNPLLGPCPCGPVRRQACYAPDLASPMSLLGLLRTPRAAVPESQVSSEPSVVVADQQMASAQCPPLCRQTVRSVHGRRCPSRHRSRSRLRQSERLRSRPRKRASHPGSA